MLTNYTNAPQRLGIIGAPLWQWQVNAPEHGDVREYQKDAGVESYRQNSPDFARGFAILHGLEPANSSNRDDSNVVYADLRSCSPTRRARTAETAFI